MRWKKEERDFLMANIGKLTYKEIADKLNKSEMAVHLYIHRNRMQPAPKRKRNLVVEILTLKFNRPEYFTPTRHFFKDIKINQKRWWDLYYGKASIREDEYKKLVQFFKVSLEEALETRQLKLFDEEDD